MNHLQELKRELEILERRITNEIRENARRFEYNIERGKAVFSGETIARHKKKAQNTIHWLLDSHILYIVSAPVVYTLIIPAVLLDLFASIFQAINFRIYGIGMVNRNDHIIMDRHRLRYLNFIERINCVYCAYFNGVMSYTGEIAARTEQFWCPIRHLQPDAPRHSHTHSFVAYGDESYVERLEGIRNDLRRITNRINAVELRPDPTSVVMIKKRGSKKSVSKKNNKKT